MSKPSGRFYEISAGLSETKKTTKKYNDAFDYGDNGLPEVER